MNPKQPVLQSPPGMSLGDVYYILFRRKWVVLSFSFCGIVAAVAAYILWPPPYQSEAKLFISFIADRRDPVVSSDLSVTSSMDRGTSMLASEVEILNSFDIAKKTAEFLQPSKILAPYGGGSNLNKAASLIAKNLVVEPPKSGQTITLTFSHEDPSVVQPVLEQVLTNYYEKQAEIHLKNALMEPRLTQEHDMLSSKLSQTETALADAKNKEGVVDLPAAMLAFSQQEGTIVQENYMTEANLAEAVANAEQLKKMIPAPSQTPGAGAATNVTSTVTNVANAATNTPARPSEEVLAAYQEVRRRLVDLQTFRDTQLKGYTTNNTQVKTNLAEIQEAQDEKQKMEKENPALLAAAPTEPGRVPEPGRVQMLNTAPVLDPVVAYNAAVGRIAELRARLMVLSNTLHAIRDRGTNLNQLEGRVRGLDRTKLADEQNLQRIDSSLYLSRGVADGESGLIPGIGIIENPTPPAPNLKKALKMIAGLAGGGIAFGLALAFALELYLDRSFKHPKDVVNRLKIPCFISIPYLNGKSRLRLFNRGKDVKLLPGTPDGVPQPVESQSNDHLPVLQDDTVEAPMRRTPFQPFYETLRDRLIACFEILNLTHKPKLVAVTGCESNAGVSSISSGLAASLSETADGNVLLVNMNSENGETHHFYKGKLTLGIDEVLEKESRDAALVGDNLYVVKESTNRDKLPGILPKRFSHLVSKMKASDYDYIIFDMPPITQISVTPRLARFMDMVLLVVESEKTQSDAAQRAVALLGDSKVNVGVVMNKTRSYVPKWLLQEF